ncbi:rhomboid family intramembrane serine protease [Humisphaera borealis]|uniref:Rhomboid family intramembrane serine protease n=1 Tax=Humisphaera borealis TaxID=2807512 RepID=A0A7M2WW97_9BACT|nr:rhomboid family intramembrane serine protease [Humisphaera borealis]QOV89683.1 rhomboid family intramembrane serine protease [Humisphaera borealis]
MFLPIRTDSPLRSSPYMNWAMIVINVFVFVAQNVISSGHSRGQWWDPWALSASEPSLLQFITSGFLHADGMHLAGNMLFLYIFGNNVNDKMGHLGYLAFYLASIIFAGLFYVLWDKQGSVIGASGGTSAVVGAYLILFPRARVTIFVLFFLGVVEIPSLWFVAAFFIKDVIGLSGQSQVAHSAHVGGTLFGVLVCVALLAVNLLPRDQFDVVALIKQWNRRRQYRDAVSSGWNPYGTAGPAAAQPPGRGWVAPEPVPAQPMNPRQAEILNLRARIIDAVANHDLPAAARGYIELKLLDPQQVLSRQAQLDVANQLAQQQNFEHAAEAYEAFLRSYPKYEQVEQVELMLGVVLNRFLNKPARAKEMLIRAMAKLMDPNSVQLARSELQKAEAALAASGSGGLSSTPTMGGAV